ncbi:ATP-binding protein [Streptomyces sp. PT12]|uniref:ATP-binding protein n=1 Tax=Streptomyces sp. PT12 TaxID=1510197 RepID=UPI000DE24711|nr:ATP-binding protein [Streptomyces sp. PT12]RBM16851.1 hypothetical protein DEH69_16080 [Streptomyces sp. PT12]
MPTHRRTFTGLPEEVSRARHWARDILGNHPHADDAALIVTELGANAITHTASATSTFTLAIDQAAGTVTITVTDAGGATTHPRIEHPDTSAQHGRGLEVVAACAAKVVIHHTENHGHTVTAELRPVA